MGDFGFPKPENQPEAQTYIGRLVKRDATTRSFLLPLSLLLIITLTINPFKLEFAMNDDLIFSFPPQKGQGEWPTPVRITIRNLHRQGKL